MRKIKFNSSESTAKADAADFKRWENHEIPLAYVRERVGKRNNVNLDTWTDDELRTYLHSLGYGIIHD